MIPMMLATLREGVEAFLIVALIVAYLKQTGRDAMLPAVWAGVVAAVAASIVIGVLLADTLVTPLAEGVLALVAAALVISMALYMRQVAPHLRAGIAVRIERVAERPGYGALIGLFALVLVMITREGMEMAFITAALARNEGSAPLLTGALLGTALAIALAVAWQRWGRRVNLKLFFQATSIVLVLFAAQLALYAFHEFTEAGVLPLDNAYWHLATEDWVEGLYGQALTAVLVLAPIAWVLWVSRRPGAAAQPAA